MTDDIAKPIDLLKNIIARDYRQTLREPNGELAYPFIVPGSAQYSDQLWDWDAWWANVALRQVLADLDNEEARSEALPYEKGCIQNFVAISQKQLKWLGWMPVSVNPRGAKLPENPWRRNIHKPCLAQHAALIVQQEGGDVEWLKQCDALYTMQTLLNWYKMHQYHEATGLYIWSTDGGVGVDDDPCSFYRPPRSTASIYLNCLMVREMRALIYLLERAALDEVADGFRREAEALQTAINRECWDERDGFYYSVDVNLEPLEVDTWRHCGRRRHWNGLIMRIGVWSGFLGLWAEVATPKQAERVVREHYRNADTFNCAAGVRTLSKMEKMYMVRGSGNQSCWLGPVWGVANYMTWRGLLKYGFEDDARELAERTIRMFGRDVERCAAMHEYYQPSNAEPILNPGFQNWNHLVLNMIAWYEGRGAVTEF
jgi:putative isomerase